MKVRGCSGDISIDHALCVTNSRELDEIAFRSTLTNNVRPVKRDLTRFREHRWASSPLRLNLYIAFFYFQFVSGL